MSIVKKASIFVRQEMFKANKVKIPDVFVFFFLSWITLFLISY